MREAVIKKTTMDMALVWRVGGAAGEDTPKDDEEGVNDGDAEDQECGGNLCGAEDGEDGEGIGNGEDAARPHIDRGGMKVMAQEADQRPGECEAERSKQWRRGECDQTECHRGKERDATRQPVEPINKVHAVLHAERPEDRHAKRNRVREQQHARTERI
ncbi:unannotated protein [freshwater metagenome]|uniref:Unannotated protein n=1 Tax=freshwater metagenome TaxID=449393 RepID=A0A6J7C354_9ZZZZ